jgi:hypothetical protein
LLKNEGGAAGAAAAEGALSAIFGSDEVTAGFEKKLCK